MSTTKITSDIFKIDSPILDVYALLSDFHKIGRLAEMAKQMGMSGSQSAKATIETSIAKAPFIPTLERLGGADDSFNWELQSTLHSREVPSLLISQFTKTRTNTNTSGEVL